MNRKWLLIFGLMIVIVSCSKTTTVYFSTSDAKGLDIGDYIMLDEQTIGEVTGFGLTNEGDVIITSNLNPEFSIPDNSKFKNAAFNEEGQRCIKVTLGNSTVNLTDMDTVRLSQTHDGIIDKAKDKLIDKIKDKFNKNK